MDFKIKMEKAIANISIGLKRKLANKVYEEYPESLQFRQGINIFASLMLIGSGFKGEVLKKRLCELNETEFIYNYLTKPIKEWFTGWDENILNSIKNAAFWNLGAFIVVDKISKRFELTYECLDYIDSLEPDVSAIDEHKVFGLLKQCSQEDYAYLRRFLIEHPLLKDFEKRELLLKYNTNDFIGEFVFSAYEEVASDTYICPRCGWTMTFRGQEIKCCSRECSKFYKRKAHNETVKTNKSIYPYRLCLGVMRYIANPGRIEMEIKKYCDENNLLSELWPEMDRYDLKVTLPNGQIWGIDAKTYSNPYLLKDSIKNDCSFQSANVDKCFYVVPDELIKEFADYLKICKSALKAKPRFDCVSLKQLKKKLRDICHE